MDPEPVIELDSIDAASLLPGLRDLQGILQELERTSRGSRSTALLQCISDLLDICQSFDYRTETERRNPSPSLERLSAHDTLNLQYLIDSAADATRDVARNLDIVRRMLEEYQRDVLSPTSLETRPALASQPWYKEKLECLQLLTRALQVLFTALNVVYQKANTDDDGSISAKTRTLASSLQRQIDLLERKLDLANWLDLESVRKAVDNARYFVKFNTAAQINCHWYNVDSPSTFFTGRDSQLRKLKRSFKEDTNCLGRKIFVVFGMGGSGKSELARKFAEDVRQQFWGVFWIDGSSTGSAEDGYRGVGVISGMGNSEKAGKNWLTMAHQPWLLIIDNVDVDDDEVSSVERLLPQSTDGNILITTRNPSIRRYGTVGDKSLNLESMEEEEANTLILTAASEPKPWLQDVRDLARRICQKLGYLPLAIVHAAASILSKTCLWSELIDHYYRQERRLSRIGPKTMPNQHRGALYTYEIMYQSMLGDVKQEVQDAIELLHVFSFFHFHNIRFDIFIRAVKCSFDEEDHAMKEAEEEESKRHLIPSPKSKTWSQWLRDHVINLYRLLNNPPPLLASMLKNSYPPKSREDFLDEVDYRLRKALEVLLRRSLIMAQAREGSFSDSKAIMRYSMHPLVHKWVRERPGMSTARQALWCQVAKTTLAKGIPINPGLADTPEETRTRCELLTHVMHVQNCQESIRKQFQQNRITSRSARHKGLIRRDFGPLQAEEAARLSRVYRECGKYNDALAMQSQVLDFVRRVRGPEDPLVIKATLFKAQTLFEASRMAEAVALQQSVYPVCIGALTEGHPLTIQMTDLLGSVKFFQGYFTDAYEMHTQAAERFEAIYGPRDKRTLKAIQNKARVCVYRWEREEAIELSTRAWEGFKECLGAENPDTLDAMMEMANSRLPIDFDPSFDKVSGALNAELDKSYSDLCFVVEERRKIFGKEGPLTLLSILYLARLKSAMGHHEEAEKDIREGLVVAERIVGESHLGVLMGKNFRARILIRMGRYADAEAILTGLIDGQVFHQMYGVEEHPDRVGALWFLNRCLEKQGRIEEAHSMCKTALAALDKIGRKGKGMEHKFSKVLKERIADLERRIRDRRRER